MKTKCLVICLLTLSFSVLFADNLVVKEGDVTLLINGQRINLEKNQSLTLNAGIMICFVEGSGTVLINDKKKLDSNHPDCYQIPVKDDFDIEKFVTSEKNKAVISTGREKYISDPNRGVIEQGTDTVNTYNSGVPVAETLSLSTKDKEFIIYNDSYGPLPITLNIKKPDGTLVKEIVNEDNSKTFFRIPTVYLENNAQIEVTNVFGDKLLNKQVTIKKAPDPTEEHSKVLYKKDDHTIVDILYGTDRKIDAANGWENYYTAKRDKLKFGVAEVSIPKIHEFGKIERPGFFQKEKTGEHIVVTNLKDINNKDFIKFLRTKLGNVEEQDILVFIPGYNSTFASTIRRTAQLAYDLKFKGVPMAYSWPSQGNPSEYMKDETSVQYTVPHLVAFLQEVIDNKDNANIHILGHSMGTRALSNALKEISFIYREKPVFKNILLAAPDIDKDVFEASLFPYIRQTTEKVTLYVSSDDSALMWSKTLHGGERVGQGGDNIFVYEGLDTIDATGIDTSLLGHSYFSEKEILITDLKEVINQSLPPSKRDSLIEKVKVKLAYWKFKLQDND